MKVTIFGKSSHTLNRIIPALLKFNKIQIQIVSDSVDNINSDDFNQISYKNYLKENNKSDFIIISTYPNRHISLLKKYKNFSNSFLIEKPITIKPEVLVNSEIDYLFENKFIDECLMYTHHPIYNKFHDIYFNSKVRKVDIEFSIPHIDSNDFRYDPSIGGGPLFDQGIYPISLFLSIVKEKFEIIEDTSTTDKNYLFELGRSLVFRDESEVQFKCTWGIGSDYKNEASIYTDDETYIFPRMFSKPDNFESHFIYKTKDKEIVENCGIHDQFYLMYKSYFENNHNKKKLKEEIVNRYKLIKKIKS